MSETKSPFEFKVEGSQIIRTTKDSHAVTVIDCTDLDELCKSIAQLDELMWSTRSSFSKEVERLNNKIIAAKKMLED